MQRIMQENMLLRIAKQVLSCMMRTEKTKRYRVKDTGMRTGIHDFSEFQGINFWESFYNRTEIFFGRSELMNRSVPESLLICILVSYAWL